MKIALHLSNGQTALVDAADLPMLMAFRWHSSKSSDGSRQYIVARMGKRMVALHRFLLDAPKGVEVDHANRDTLDNRRSNLRLATRSQNLANRRRGSNFPELLGLRGVARQRKRWRASFQALGKNLRGPTRDHPISAAFDFDRWANESFGEFASLNFPCRYGGAR